MNQVNPKNIKKAEIAVGIPSLNEADSIARVVKNTDRGLCKYFKGRKAVIINADNNSKDGTKKVFLSTKTKNPKIYISTPSGTHGKGRNVCNFFKKCKTLGAKAAMITDADIESSSPEWVKCLLSPVLKEYDLVTPIYKRHKYDGTITNFVCYPFVYGFFGQNIRQPIGGDMGFSGSFINYLLKQKWHKTDYQFGVDIFITTNAIKGGFKISQSKLGKKSHKPSGPKLNFMFLEVAESFFRNIKKTKKLWQKKEKNHLKKTVRYPEAEEWSQVCYDMFFAYDKARGNKQIRILKELRDLYFLRVSNFINETKKMGQKRAESKITNQAKIFYKNRNYLINKY